MLGEKLGEDRGKVETYRVLPAAGGKGISIEVSYRSMGKLLGIEYKNIATYHSEMQPGGTLFGEGQGALMSSTGEMGCWKGQGVGHFRPDGGLSWRGAIFIQSDTPAWKKLNGVAAVFEHEADPNDTITSAFWEWK